MADEPHTGDWVRRSRISLVNLGETLKVPTVDSHNLIDILFLELIKYLMYKYIHIERVQSAAREMIEHDISQKL